MGVQEVAEGIYRIDSVFGGRLLYLYLYAGDDHTLLVDSGASVTPAEVLFPALEHLVRKPDTLLVTHCDLDHQGGNAQLRAVFPDMVLACGAGDEELVSDPRVLVERRYSAWEQDHGVGFPTEVKPRLLHLSGTFPVKVDRTFTGGERIRLSDDWSVELLNLSGHSKGHLGVFDPRSKTAVTQDAVHGADYPFADGRPWALMPTYYYIEPYLDTIEKLRRLSPEHLHTAHWPEAIGTAVSVRLDESQEYVLRADALVYELVSGGQDTLCKVMDVALPRLGKWDASKAGDFGCSMHGHLERMVDAGILGVWRTEGLIHYEAIRGYQPPGA